MTQRNMIVSQELPEDEDERNEENNPECPVLDSHGI